MTSLAAWWEQHGRADYPQAKRLLVLCDGGGSNSATMYLFKEDLQKLATRLGIEIRIAHYPPYCSKYNPIEHRLFPHLTRACRGVIFQTLETVRYYMGKAETTTGLKVKVSILEKVYETGRKYAAGFKETMKIVFDTVLPRWNYRASSSTGVSEFRHGIREPEKSSARSLTRIPVRTRMPVPRRRTYSQADVVSLSRGTGHQPRFGRLDARGRLIADLRHGRSRLARTDIPRRGERPGRRNRALDLRLG